MTREKTLFLILQLVGGTAVLASYVYGFLTNPGSRWEIWGGVPSSLQPLYTVSMLLAAAGYFPMTTFLLLRVDARVARVAGRYGFGIVPLAYTLVLVGSAVWMPLTYQMIAEPSPGLWIAIRATLGMVALGSLGLLLTLTTLNEQTPRLWHRLAVLGCVLFCWQTVVLDALVWPYYFPL